jgi:hypothetical protein
VNLTAELVLFDERFGDFGDLWFIQHPFIESLRRFVGSGLAIHLALMFSIYISAYTQGIAYDFGEMVSKYTTGDLRVLPASSAFSPHKGHIKASALRIMNKIIGHYHGVLPFSRSCCHRFRRSLCPPQQHHHSLWNTQQHRYQQWLLLLILD